MMAGDWFSIFCFVEVFDKRLQKIVALRNEITSDYQRPVKKGNRLPDPPLQG